MEDTAAAGSLATLAQPVTETEPEPTEDEEAYASQLPSLWRVAATQTVPRDPDTSNETPQALSNAPPEARSVTVEPFAETDAVGLRAVRLVFLPVLLLGVVRRVPFAVLVGLGAARVVPIAAVLRGLVGLFGALGAGLPVFVCRLPRVGVAVPCRFTLVGERLFA